MRDLVSTNRGRSCGGDVLESIERRVLRMESLRRAALGDRGSFVGARRFGDGSKEVTRAHRGHSNDWARVQTARVNHVVDERVCTTALRPDYS